MPVFLTATSIKPRSTGAPSPPPPPPPSGASWHPAVVETPRVVTVAQFLASGSLYTIPNKRGLPPSVTNPIQAGPGAGVGPVPNGFLFEIDNVTVQSRQVAGDGEAFTYNGVFYDDTEVDIIDPSLPAGLLRGIHCEADMNWKLNNLTSMTDYPNANDIISVQGYSYWDQGNSGSNLGNGREVHALIAWKDSSGNIHMVQGAAPPPPPPPPIVTGSGFDSTTWFINNTNGDASTTGSLTISPTPTGSLIERLSTSGGNDNSYGYSSALRGSFPFAASHGTALPSGIITVDSDVNFIGYILNPSTPQRFHLFIALYYQLSQSVTAQGSGPYAWLDTQRRSVYDSRQGGFLPIGTVERYDPGDSFGTGFVVTNVNAGSSFHFTIDVEANAIAAMQAWGIPTTIGHTLKGIEIGAEGFRINALNSDWPDYSLNAGSQVVSRQKTYTVNIDLKGQSRKTSILNLLLKALGTIKTYTTDIKLAIGVGTPTKNHSIDIDLFNTQTKTHNTNLLVRARNTKTATIDINLLRRASKTYTINLDKKGTIKKTHSIDVLLGAGAGGGGLYFDNMVVIVLENESIDQIYGTATFLTNLANTYAFAEHYSGIDHPSEPNYLAMGFGLAGDCSNPAPNIGGCMTGGDDSTADHSSTAPNNPTNMGNGPSIFDRLEGAGLTWSAYLESYNGTNSFSGGYHAWMLFQNNIVNNPARKAHIKAFSTPSPSALINELNTNTGSNLIWVHPDNNHNMHDNGVKSGDDYMSTLIPQILNSNTFLTKRALLFVVFDEGNDHQGSPTQGLDLIYTCLAGPLVKPGYKSGDFNSLTGTPYTHYSLTHTILVNWGLASLQTTDAGATTMSEFFIGH